MLDKIQFLLSLQILGFCVFGGITLLLRARENKGYKYSYKFYFDGKEIKFHDLVACIWIPKLNKK